MKKFFALNSLTFLSLVFLSPLFFSCSLIPASAPDLAQDGGEIACRIPLNQLQIIYLRPALQKAEQPDSEIKEDQEEKFGSEQDRTNRTSKKKKVPHHRSLSSNGSYVLELQRMMAHPDLIQVICPYCTEVQMVPSDAHIDCTFCGSAFASPKMPIFQEFGPDSMPDYAPLTPQELAMLDIAHTKPVRQSMGMQDCAVHALANALAINSALANHVQNIDIKKLKKLVDTKTHDLYYAKIEKACGHDTYNLSSDKIQQALTAITRENKGAAVSPHIFTNIFVVDNVRELPLLEAIRKAVVDLPTQPEENPQAAIHFICNTRPYYGDPEQLHGHQAGKHWVTLSLIKQENKISFYFSDSNHGSVPATLHPLIRILAERYKIIDRNQNPQYQAPREQSSALVSLFKWLIGY
jgi:ribosomal protein S27E